MFFPEKIDSDRIMRVGIPTWLTKWNEKKKMLQKRPKNCLQKKY